jgi:hypothetical protein
MSRNNFFPICDQFTNCLSYYINYILSTCHRLKICRYCNPKSGDLNVTVTKHFSIEKDMEQK